jgi:outer membrane protein OmpA-like peptidoglycan-associated protein
MNNKQIWGALVGVVLFSFFSVSCEEGKNDSSENQSSEMSDSSASSGKVGWQGKLELLDGKRQRVKLGHSINTAANEYLPVIDPSGLKFYFSGMDRTGFFDFKLDFTKEKSAGGEDIFLSEKEEGIWLDARPISAINTNGHEVVSQVLKNGDLVVTANYPENLGVKQNTNAGVQTTDLFWLKRANGDYQINHFPEPVNSIFTEADGWMAEDKSFILFVSDRPGHVGEYHKKGWKWNDSFWGNTDIYVCVQEGDFWSVPINLGPLINTQFAERTPWLSKDGLTLYLSSNGYKEGRTDLEVYAFKRKSTSDWTSWTGPYEIVDANTQYDDWGYKETDGGVAYLASAEKLNYKPTQRGAAGDAGIRETNFRTGYELFGLQTAALDSEFETNIYSLLAPEKPSFTIDEVFFDFNSFSIKKEFEKYLVLISDQISQNKQATIQINGHTDNVGNPEYNQELSIKRADAIKEFLINNGIQNPIVTKGLGATKPISSKQDKDSRAKNRRVEIFLN